MAPPVETVVDIGARIGRIIGEYHNRAAFNALVAERFSGWKLRVLSDGDVGTFWARRDGR